MENDSTHADLAHRNELVRFQTNLLDAVRQAVVATDFDGRIIFWNRAAEALFGWPRDEALAAELLDFDAPTETRQKTLEVLSALKTGESWSGEMVLQHRDGSQFPAMVTGSPIPDPDGEFTGIVGIVTDLSDVKETEAALRERVKELRTLYRASRIINRHDIPMTERLEELVGLLPGGWLYPRLTETRIALNGMVVHSDGFRVTPWMQTATVQADGTRLGQIDVALTEQRPDRDEGPFLAEERDLLDNLARLIGDAAERDRLTRLLEQTFASLDVAVVIVDSLDGGRGILDVNPAAERIFGCDRDELIGHTTEKIHVDREAFEQFAHDSEPALRQTGVYHGTFPLRRKDGTVFDAEQTVTLLDRGKGLDGGVVSVVRDVSERARLEKKLRQSQKMEAIGRLAGGIAHDFNNLLTVIQMQADLLLTDHAGSSIGEEVELIQHATQRAARLTEQLLAFSREQVLEPRVVDLNATVRSTGELLDRLLGESIMMQFDLADELPAIEVDPGQLEQVIMNLAVNARDAMPAGGVLSFSTAVHTIGVREAAETGDIAPGDYVVLEVSDTGSGIDPETLTRIFDPFFSTKELGKGTGLGLATAYGVVTQSGGAIRATSDVGEGTTLTLLFPVAAEKVVETEPAAAPRSQPVADTEVTQTVLLVEDSPDVRRVAARVLERAGYHVQAHEDAVEALEALQEGAEVDVVLTDLVLPTMSGPDLVQGIRETLPDLPIVAMSGYSEGAADRRRLPDDVEFVAKPFSPHRLVEVIRRAVEDVQ